MVALMRGFANAVSISDVVGLAQSRRRDDRGLAQ